MAKAIIHINTDTEARRRRDQIGLDTRVVYAVNYEYKISYFNMRC